MALIGYIGVDAGLCWIGDPCYILHPEDGLPEALGKSWLDFCAKLRDGVPTMKSFNYDLGHEGLGICVSTGYGDGFYPVFAKVEEGCVMAVVIKFDFHGEFESR